MKITINKLLCLVLVSIYSCKNDRIREVKNYHKNGNLKSIEYFDKIGNYVDENKYFKESGSLDYSIFYINGEVASATYFYESGEKKYHSRSIENNIIKKISYYKNGKIKIIGDVRDNKRFGWWKKYDLEGNLIEEYEFINKDDTEYLNQTIFYDKNRKIIDEKSSFFYIDIPDTLILGKNMGKLNYHSFTSKDSEKHIYVIVDSKDNTIKKDTFYVDSDRNKFGIHTCKVGRQTINGIILEREFNMERLHEKKDSFALNVIDNYKYFEKDVIVINKK